MSGPLPITVLRCADDRLAAEQGRQPRRQPRRAAKRWYIDPIDEQPVKEDFAAGMYFDLYLCPVASIRALGALLAEVENDPLAHVIRGVPKPGIEAGACVRRKKKVDAKTGKQPSFMEAEDGLYWAMFDFDKVELPPHIDAIKDPEAAVLYLVSRLPEQFQNRTFFWQASASAGMGDRRSFSAHVWFWFSRPVTGAELTLWAELNDVPVDISLFRTVQPHWTARPIFDDGIVDPLPRRSGLWCGAEDVVDFPRLGTHGSGWDGTVPPDGSGARRRGRARPARPGTAASFSRRTVSRPSWSFWATATATGGPAFTGSCSPRRPPTPPRTGAQAPTRRVAEGAPARGDQGRAAVAAAHGR